MLHKEYLYLYPHVDVQSPTSVVCRLCKTEIKLFSKGTYRPYHWDKHIEHCKVKMNEKVVSKRNNSAAEVSKMKDLISQKRLYRLPGSTLLKLKISHKTHS